MGKWFKRIVKIIVVIGCALLIWRVWFASDKSVFGDLVPTKATAELYSANGELKVLTNDIVDDMSAGGYFSIYGMYYTPDTKELQVTVRFNDSTIDKLGDISFYGYTVDTSAPAEENSSVRLHEGYPVGDILTPVSRGTEKKLFYNYENLVFENVEIGESINFIVSLCAKDNPEGEHAVVVAHFAEQPMKEYKLSGKEKDALSSYSE